MVNQMLLLIIACSMVISSAFQRVGVRSALSRGRIDQPLKTGIVSRISDKRLRLEGLNTNPRKIDVGEESIARFGKVSS